MNRREIAKRNQIIQRRYELLYYPKVKKAIQKKISSLIETVKTEGVSVATGQISQDVDSGDLPKVIEDLYLKVGLRFARMQWSEFLKQKRQTKGFGFNEVWVGFIKDFLFRFLLEKITFQVSEYTRQVLLNTLNTAIEEGWGVDKIVKELDDLPISKTQAARIVRTEITRAANTGAMAAGSTFEFEQEKEWIAAMDMRTRGRDPEDHASHVKLDGQVIDYDGYFTDSRNGDKLRFPGDPGGNGLPDTKPESTINCRCSIALVGKRDERGRLIPRKKAVVKEEEIEMVQKEDIINGEEYAQVIKIPSVNLTPLNEKIKSIKWEVDEAIDGVKGMISDEVAAISKVLGKSLSNEDTIAALDQLKSKVENIKIDPGIMGAVGGLSERMDRMTMEIVAAINMMKEEMTKPKRWKHTVSRNYNDLIVEIKSEQIK